MILRKKLNRKIVLLIIMASIFLIIPSSFANDQMANHSTNISIDNEYENLALEPTENTELLTHNYNEVYVNSSYEPDNGIGTKERPVRTISEGLNIVNSGGTIYLNGKFSGESNSNLTLEGNPDGITFIGTGKTTVDGNHSTTFAIIKEGKYTFRDITFINNHKTSADTQF